MHTTSLFSNAHQIARIENFFIFNAKYSLTAKEQKVILYLVSKLDTVRQVNLHEQVVPIKDLKNLLIDKSTKNGSFYEEIQRFSERIMEKRIKFQTDIEYGGKRLSGRINWFQSITPVRNEQGEACLEFLFSEKLKPFLLELKEYTQLDYQETLKLNSGFSIRIFQVFRAHRDRMSKYEDQSSLRYSIEELKSLLGVQGKYKDWRNFKRRVVEVLIKEINEHTSIKVVCTEIRKGRKIIGLEFSFSDKSERKKTGKQARLFEPLRLEKMTRSQKMSFDKLVAYGVRDSIALEMISRLKHSEFRGFEDWYFEIILRIFAQITKTDSGQARAGTLVKWFIERKVFEKGEHYTDIMKYMQEQKEDLQQNQPHVWQNRLKARDMTARDFEVWYKERQVS